jgi:hypothetical protein
MSAVGHCNCSVDSRSVSQRVGSGVARVIA